MSWGDISPFLECFGCTECVRAIGERYLGEHRLCFGWTDCFEQGDLARHGLLPQPGEFFNFSTFRATLYGPPINRSSYEAVAKSYAAGFKVIAKTINEALCIFKGVADASDFRGEFCLIRAPHNRSSCLSRPSVRQKLGAVCFAQPRARQ